MQRKKVSLGGAIWGFPAAYGLTVPSENAPDAWLLILREKHGAADLYQGLFSSCRVGKEWSLRHAPNAKVKLLVPAQQGRATFKTQLKGVDSDIGIRNPERTVLAIEFDQANAGGCPEGDNPVQGEQALLMIPDYIKGRQSVSELQVVFKGSPKYDLATQFMAKAAKVFNNATSLEVPTCILPLPDQFASVTKLSIPRPHGPQEAAINQSIASFVPKVTELHYTRGQPPPWRYGDPHPSPHPVWTQVFTAPSNTLTHFTTSYALNDTLAALLSQHTPHLAELHVSAVSLTPASDALHWSVQRLFVDHAYVPHLVNLPAHEGQLELTAKDSWSLDVDGANAPHPDLLARLPQFTFRVPEAVPMANHYSECGKVAFKITGDNAAVLVNHLQLLATIQTTANMSILLVCGRYNLSIAPVAANAMQGLSGRFIIGLQLPYLTDQHVAWLMNIGDIIRGVSVDRVCTRGAQYPAGAVWSSGKLNVTGKLSVSPLLYLPPAPQGGHIVVGSNELRLCDQHPNVDLQRAPNLQQVRFEPLTAGGNFHVYIGGSSKHTRSNLPLRSQITLLQNIHVQTVPTRIVWSGPLTRPAVDALQGLPAREGAVIDWTEATWPMKAPDYRQWAMSIPPSYKEWVLKLKVPCEYSVAIFEGINDKRRGLRRSKLKVRIFGQVAEGAVVPKRIKIVQ